LIDGPFWDYNLSIIDFDGKLKERHTGVRSMAVSPDGTMLILAHNSGKILIRNIATNRQIDEIIVETRVFAIEIFPDSLKFVAITSKWMRVYDILTHAILHEVEADITEGCRVSVLEQASVVCFDNSE
jgi:WD40 repeat protein